MEDIPGTSSRRSARSKVLLSAALEFGGGSYPVNLRNLSENGALIQGTRLLEPGCEVLFRRNDLSVPGRVAWVQGDFAGIAFNAPLERADVLRQVTPASAKPVPQRIFGRPGVTHHRLSPADLRWLQQWMGTSGSDRPGE